MPEGGWAWRSAIQAPHYHTDRDVGAASVGEGLLAAYAVTDDARYQDAAVAAGDYLLGVAEPAAGGLRWPDWADPNGQRSTTHFTSFDDGAAGISDYLWRLFEVTHMVRFHDAAVAGMRWLVTRAEGPVLPRQACSWTWTDDTVERVAYHGVGMGQAGVVLALDYFADRTGDPTFRAYARAGAAHLREMTANGTRPLSRGWMPSRFSRPVSSPALPELPFCSSNAISVTAIPSISRRARQSVVQWSTINQSRTGTRGLRWPVEVDDATVPYHRLRSWVSLASPG